MPSSPRSVLLGVALTILVGGCAQNPTTNELPPPRASQTASPVAIPGCSDVAPPSVTPPAGELITPSAAANTVTVTGADAGATVFLTLQQHLVVAVGSAGPPAWSGTPQGAETFWTPPHAPYPGPLYREGLKSCPGGNSLAVFTAVGTGGTTVAATTDAPCLHTQPVCEIGQQVIEIYVVVRQPR